MNIYMTLVTQLQKFWNSIEMELIPKVLAFLLCTDESVDDYKEDEHMGEESDEDDSEEDELEISFSGVTHIFEFIR